MSYYTTTTASTTSAITQWTMYSGAGSSSITTCYDPHREIRIPVDELLRMLRREGYAALRKARRAVMPPLRFMDFGKADDMLSPIPYPRMVDGYELRDPGQYLLPDGTVLGLDAHGSVVIDDSEAKVVYKANRIREFNPYINASDLLEKFIDDLGRLGVSQSDFARVPVMAFLNWLVLEAAKKDGDPTDELPPVQAALPAPPSKQPRCGYCKRWIRWAWVAAGVNFCSPQHMERKLLGVA